MLRAYSGQGQAHCGAPAVGKGKVCLQRTRRHLRPLLQVTSNPENLPHDLNGASEFSRDATFVQTKGKSHFALFFFFPLGFCQELFIIYWRHGGLWYLSHPDNVQWFHMKNSLKCQTLGNLKYIYACLCAWSLSCVPLFATLWIVAHQASLSVGFSRQEYWKHWSGLPCPTPGDLPDSGIEPKCPVSPALAGTFFTTVPSGKSHIYVYIHYIYTLYIYIQSMGSQRVRYSWVAELDSYIYIYVYIHTNTGRVGERAGTFNQIVFFF